MIKHLIRAFIGHRLPPKTPPLWLDRLFGEWRHWPIESQEQTHTRNEDDTGGTVTATAVLGPMSLWVHPPKSWKQRLKNYRDLRSGKIRYFAEMVLDEQTAAIVMRRDEPMITLTNLSPCCWEPMLYHEWQFSFGPRYRCRCSMPGCPKVYAGHGPNGPVEPYK